MIKSASMGIGSPSDRDLSRALGALLAPANEERVHLLSWVFQRMKMRSTLQALTVVVERVGYGDMRVISADWTDFWVPEMSGQQVKIGSKVIDGSELTSQYLSPRVFCTPGYNFSGDGRTFSYLLLRTRPSVRDLDHGLLLG